MRKRIAIALSIATVAMLTGLSLLFALRQNPAPVAETGPEQGVLQESDSAAGHRVFRAEGCGRCHAVQGVGRRYPLDGVGSRRTLDELRAWTIGAPAVHDSLSPSAARAKQRYLQLPPDEMRLLLFYLGTLVEHESS